MIEVIEYETLLSGGAFGCSAVLCPFGNRQYLILMFHGQKPTIHGQNGMKTVFTVCYRHSRQTCIAVTYLNGGKLMRHFYFRLIFGIVWLAAAVVSTVRSNISFAALYAVLGIVFLWSAYSIRKKEKDEDNDQ